MRYLEGLLYSGNSIAIERVHIPVNDFQLLAALAPISSADMPIVNGVCIALDGQLLTVLHTKDYAEYIAMTCSDAGFKHKIKLSAMQLRRLIYATRCCLARNQPYNSHNDAYAFDMYSLKGYEISFKENQYLGVKDVLYYDGPRLSVWADSNVDFWLWTALDSSSEFGFAERNMLASMTIEAMNGFMNLGVSYMATLKQASCITFFEKHYYSDEDPRTPFAINVAFEDIPADYLPDKDYYFENGSIKILENIHD
jgi:hypothetical protein